MEEEEEDKSHSRYARRDGDTKFVYVGAKHTIFFISDDTFLLWIFTFQSVVKGGLILDMFAI